MLIRCIKSVRINPGWFFALGLVPILAYFLTSCSTLERTVVQTPAIPGATFVGNQRCYDCHTNYVRSFAGSPHARVHFTGGPPGLQTGCESCHGPGSLHVSAGGGRGRSILNPGREPAVCLNCHLQTHAEFRLPQHHPVLEGKLSCANCHDPHGFDIMKPARGLAMARQNESCAECHRDQTRVFAFEHEAMREGCTVCHQPHGSVNAKMLVQRDNNLCLKCHAQTPGDNLGSGKVFIGHVDHTDKLRLGGCYSSGCHTAVHGSNVDRRLLY